MRIYKKREKIPITKYNPKFRNNLGHFEKEEWTSISDINKIYNGKLFTFEDYLKAENLYVKSIILALSFFKSKSIKITHIYKLDKKEDFKKHNSLGLYNTYISIKNGNIIKDEKTIDDLIRLRLREHIGELELTIDSKSRSEILFGFDYYMYLNTNKDVTSLLKQISSTGLFAY